MNDKTAKLIGRFASLVGAGGRMKDAMKAAWKGMTWKQRTKQRVALKRHVLKLEKATRIARSKAALPLVLLGLLFLTGCVCAPLKDATQRFARSGGPLEVFVDNSRPSEGVDEAKWDELKKALLGNVADLDRLARE